MTPRESCDVLIVGGGPAGSACARQLGRAGFDVLILDKSQFPRDKVCAGWITPQVVEELEIDTRDYQQGRVLQPITSAALIVPLTSQRPSTRSIDSHASPSRRRAPDRCSR